MSAQERNVLIQNMLQQHQRVLERHIKENNAEQIAIWQQKIDKLKSQLDDGGASMSNVGMQQTSGYASPPHQYASSAPPPTFTQQYSPAPAQTQPPPQVIFSIFFHNLSDEL